MLTKRSKHSNVRCYSQQRPIIRILSFHFILDSPFLVEASFTVQCLGPSKRRRRRRWRRRHSIHLEKSKKKKKKKTDKTKLTKRFRSAAGCQILRPFKHSCTVYYYIGLRACEKEEDAKGNTLLPVASSINKQQQQHKTTEKDSF